MKSLLKKMVMGGLSVVMIAATLTGCSTATNSEKGGSNEKRTKISMMFPLYTEPPQKNDVWKMIEDRFNIELELMAVPNNSYEEKLKVTLASGSMPDLLLWTKFPDSEFNKYAEEGAFAELDDRIKSLPNIMKTPEAVFENARVDGKLYGVPRPRALTRAAVMIRQDWLENLGLPVPKTLDDFYKTAIAFTKDDPDGNNKPDTFGITLGENLSHLDPLWAAFDAGYGWKVQEDGTLISDAISPGSKQALEWLSKLYQEGGLDKDFAVLKNTQVWEKIEGGKAGILLGGQTSDYARYVDNLSKIDPKAKLIMIEPPVGPTGKSGFGETSGFSGQWVIPAKTNDDKISKLLELIEWMSSEEAYSLKRHGIEGVHHTKDSSGNIQMNIDKFKAEGVDATIQHNPFDPNFYVVTTAPEDVQQHQKNNLDMVQNMGVKNPAISYIAPSALDKLADLTKLRDEEFVSIVMGKLPLADFDRYAQEWLDKGGAKITEETNAWYHK